MDVKRRLRKGTHSCWECKRRKMRCVFDPRNGALCVGCLHRGSRCVGQEYPEELAHFQMRNSMNNGDSYTARETHTHTSHPFSSGLSTDYNRLDDGVSTLVSTSISTTGFEPLREQHVHPSSHPRHPSLSRILHGSLPPREDIEKICKASHQPSVLAYEIMTLPYSTLDEAGLKTPAVLLDIPEPDAHPVLIARYMLLLASFLQYLRPTLHKDISGLSESPRIIMERLINRAVDSVTTNDKFLGSMESLECVMIESVLQANIGNLRRSWLSGRRAMSIAQLMGLNRPHNQTQHTILNPATSYHPQLMWFRIVFLDRYLCLMLGVSQGCSDHSMASEALLASDTPMGRLERLHCVIASRIIERNELSMSAAEEASLTRKLDAELQSAARSLPSCWWLAPPLDAATVVDKQERFWNTRRIFAQLLHYNLLNQLHLPYMLRTSSSLTGDRRSEYAHITCVNASREVLSRFLTLRGSTGIAYTCRTVDFLALMTAMTLLLAHLNSVGGDSENLLAHQYYSDRAMIEQVQKNMEETNLVSSDVLSERSAALLRQLLSIDMETAHRDRQDLRRVSVQAVGAETATIDTDESVVVRVHIPYFGVIKITREGINKEIPKPPAKKVVEPVTRPAQQTQPRETPYEKVLTPFNASNEMLPTMSDINGPTQPEPGNMQSIHADEAAQLGQLPDSLWTYDNYYPGLVAEGEQWAFQGVDMTFFENLMRGSGDGDVPGVDWGGVK